MGYEIETNYEKNIISQGSPITKKVTAKYSNATPITVLTEQLAQAIPNRFDVVVGIPDAGLFVANILAAKFGRPLSTPEMFEGGKIWCAEGIKKPQSITSVLLVGDSVLQATKMKKAKVALKDTLPRLEVRTASLCRCTEGFKVDFYSK